MWRNEWGPSQAAAGEEEELTNEELNSHPEEYSHPEDLAPVFEAQEGDKLPPPPEILAVQLSSSLAESSRRGDCTP